MADYDQIMTALRNADKAGDTVAAKRLAAMAIAAKQPKTLNEKEINYNPLSGVAEGGLHLASGGAGMVAGGARGLFDLATGQGMNKANQDIQSTENALTYQPRTAAGRVASGVIDKAFGVYNKGADWAASNAGDAADRILELAGIKPTTARNVGNAVDTGVYTAAQLAPALLMRGRAPEAVEAPRVEPTMSGFEKPKPPPVDPAVEEAKHYVANNTSLDWDSLAEKTKAQLTQIAHSSGDLSNLDPKAVERQARLDSLGIPATRGQITRDIAQITREEQVARHDAGLPIRETQASQDAALYKNLETLKGRVNPTGAKSDTAVGGAVQGTLRSKYAKAKSAASKLYKEADEAGETEQPVSAASLLDRIQNSPGRSYLKGYMGDLRLFKAYTRDPETGEIKPGEITLRNLETIRQKAAVEAKDPTPKGHWNSELLKVFDDMTEGAGGEKYQTARSAWKAMSKEFKNQGAVRGLVSDKKGSAERQIALEDTWDKVILRGSLDDIDRVKRSLLTGGDKETRTAGRQAWRDIRGQTIQYLKEQAGEDVAPKNMRGEPEFRGPTFMKALDRISDEKIDSIFGKNTARRLRVFDRAIQDLRKPSARVAGSDTVPRLMAFLSKLEHAPITDVGRGLVRKIGELKEKGAEAKKVEQALTTPLEEAAAKAKKSPKSANMLKDLENEKQWRQ